MKFKEYGKKGAPIVVLVHGEYASSWNYEEQAVILSEHFFVILPQWGFGQKFESIHQCAEEIVEYLESHEYGRISVLAGTGMGGQIILDILSENPFLCSDCILESVPLGVATKEAPWASLLYILSKIPLLVHLKACQFHIPGDKYNEFLEDQKKETYTNYQNMMKARSEFKLPSLYRVQAKTLILVGENESKPYRQSAQLLYRSLIDSELELTHTKVPGEFGRSQTQYYVVRLIKLYRSIL